MPAISLVVCLRKERDFLARLLRHAEGCYDDLVVVHDGPEFEVGVPPPVAAPPAEMAMDYAEIPAGSPIPPFYRAPTLPPKPGSTHELVLQHGGRYFEGPRCYQQEPHWPFAWSQAEHDWILRLDADEYPSTGLKEWLCKFRATEELLENVSGYLGIWPLWNGSRKVGTNLPPFRVFLFNKRRVRFFGMVEQGPTPDTMFEPVRLEICHKPTRKSYGIENLMFRGQAYRWRHVIAASLLEPPTRLPCWRWNDPAWPDYWECIRQTPFLTAISRGFRSLPSQLRFCWKFRCWVPMDALLGTALHQVLMPITYMRVRSKDLLKS